MSTNATLLSTAMSVVIVERPEDPQVWYRIHCSRNWTVYLNELPVGRLPEGGSIAIPIAEHYPPVITETRQIFQLK